MTSSGPYSIGYNGHAKSCNCGPCSKARARDLMARIRENTIKPPALDATIYVRAHFRRGKYLTKTPRTARLYKALLRREFRS